MKKCVHDYIDKYVKCDILDDRELAEFVCKVQKHKHSATCRRNGECRLHYPRPPSPHTLIAHEFMSSEEESEEATLAKETLVEMRKCWMTRIPPNIFFSRRIV